MTDLPCQSTYKELKKAIKRAAELHTALTEPRLLDLERARKALVNLWPFLRQEPDLDDAALDGLREECERLIGAGK